MSADDLALFKFRCQLESRPTVLGEVRQADFAEGQGQASGAQALERVHFPCVSAPEPPTRKKGGSLEEDTLGRPEVKKGGHGACVHPGRKAFLASLIDSEAGALYEEEQMLTIASLPQEKTEAKETSRFWCTASGDLSLSGPEESFCLNEFSLDRSDREMW